MFTYPFPRPALTADVAAFTCKDDRLHVLLIRRGIQPFLGTWALPGGFVGIEEPLEAAAASELEEETGLAGIPLEQFQAYGNPQRDPRGRTVTVAFLALIAPGTPVRSEGGSDARQACWFPVDGLPTLAFDHAQILPDALDTLRVRLLRKSIGRVLLPEIFNLQELTYIYQILMGEPVDSRWLRRTLLENRVIEAELPTGGGRIHRYHFL
jgi:8-oxo-dGTP diphosphatase